MNKKVPLRQFSFVDQVIGQIEDLLHSHHDGIHSDRPYPAEHIEDGSLTDVDKKHSAGLMRVNHSGEIAHKPFIAAKWSQHNIKQHATC